MRTLVKNRVEGLLVLVAIPLLFGIGVFQNRHFIHDDAYISLRYCSNLLQGHGLTWNPGERVEGYTNFLHIMLIGGLGWLGADLTVAARVVNFAALVLTILFVAMLLFRRAARARAETSLVSVAVPVLLVAASYPLITWCWGGLEGPLFALLSTVGIGLTLAVLEGRGGTRSAALAGLAFALTVLTRPDGVVFCAVALVFMAVPLCRRKRYAGRHWLALLVVFGLVVLAHAAWRVSYYGDWVPNTFYAKMMGLPRYRLDMGLMYLTNFCLAPPYILPLTLLLSPFALRGANRKMSVYLATNLAAYLAFIVSAGGDHMPAFRLMLPLIPVCALLLYASLDNLTRGALRGNVPAVAVVSVLLVAIQIRQPGGEFKDPAAFYGTIIGDYIRDAWPAGSLVALHTAGSTPYFAPENTYIDMLGLNDRHIARRKIPSYQLSWQWAPGHGKGDGEYVLSRKPDYIILGAALGAHAQNPWFLSDVELRDNPEFHQTYQMRIVRIDAKPYYGYEKMRSARTGFVRFIYYERAGSG
jgi:arabinofuranosyltransferase